MHKEKDQSDSESSSDSSSKSKSSDVLDKDAEIDEKDAQSDICDHPQYQQLSAEFDDLQKDRRRKFIHHTVWDS